MFVPLSRPDITGQEIEAVIDIMKSGILSIGPKVNEFEETIADYVGLKHAVAVNSGTSALHLIVRSLGLEQGQTMLTSSFTFVSSANVAIYEGAIPVFADIEESSLNISPQTLEEALERYAKKGLETDCMNLPPFQPDLFMGVDIFGHPMDWDEIERICERNGLPVIEDSCEALGTVYKDRKAGSFGLAGAFAFYPNKQITTGEGGVIVTNDASIAQMCRSMRNQGRGISENWLEHVRLGYNYRLDELSSAMGLEQMRRIDEILSKRDSAAKRYSELLSRIDGVTVPAIADYVTSLGWFVYVIRLEDSIDRDGFMDYLRDNGVQCRDYFRPVHLQPFYIKQYGYKEGMLPVTERVSRQTVAIPFFSNLSQEEQEYVAETITRAVERSG
ncbi:MAG: DegT/DnrJ/EryC1/StrS family aminotransferase [Dehalobacter sp. 4CP]|nr:DegT/DnrJ/EryC1/StrS family aminotransferase [Dehalobacter sp. 4CP]